MKTLRNVLFIIFCLGTTPLMAQISIGVKGGHTTAWPDYGDIQLPENADTKVKGYNVSLLGYYKVNRFLQLGIEPGFVNRGAACEPGWQPIFVGDSKLLLDYIEAPVFVSGHLPLLNDKLEIFGKVGYGWSMITSAMREQINFADGTKQTTKLDPDDPDSSSLNRFDHGLYGSFGIGYNLGTHQLFVESAYYHGLRDVDLFNASKNRSLNLNVGYKINLKR